jgi:hypothetical protein
MRGNQSFPQITDTTEVENDSLQEHESYLMTVYLSLATEIPNVSIEVTNSTKCFHKIQSLLQAEQCRTRSKRHSLDKADLKRYSCVK